MFASLHLPTDHKLSKVYRIGGAATGIVLLVFGVLGFTDNLDFFSTSGDEVAGLSSNGLLSTLSRIEALGLRA